MRISIIVPAFNEERILATSLGAIKGAMEAFSPHDCEVIVCNNNSTDRTAEIAAAAGARVIFEPINQISRARNRGASIARGDWLMFVDADSFPTRQLFARALQRMLDPKCAGGGCLVKLDEDEWISRGVVSLWNWLSRTMRWAAGSFIFCDTVLFRKIGGFSTALYASEEIDLSRRLKRAANAQGRKLIIITEERLVTSARKLHLYSKGEHLRFMAKALLFPRRVLASPEECTLWYNGRR